MVFKLCFKKPLVGYRLNYLFDLCYFVSLSFDHNVWLTLIDTVRSNLLLLVRSILLIHCNIKTRKGFVISLLRRVTLRELVP